MKTFLKTLDVRETEPEQFTEHEFTDNNASKKASSNIKWKLTLLVTLAITLAAFLMTSCDDEPEFCSNCSSMYPTPPVPPYDVTSPITIRSIYPTDGEPGSTVNIILENFTDSNVDNHVTFGSTLAEIIHARHGMINVRVPMDLPNGEYKVTVRSHGQIASAPTEFKVTKATK